MSNRISYTEDFVYNSRGIRLFTCRWVPISQEVKGLVFLCHGYGMECSNFMKGTGIRLSRAGYAVFGIDYEGHGKSDGRRCYIRKFTDLVDDCASFFRRIRSWPEYRSKPSFLYGESMGGAVAILVQRKRPVEWNGAIFVAPMCKISQNMKPHPMVIRVLVKLSRTIPTWKIVPIKDVIDQAFKDPAKREEIRENPYIYQGRPRLRTAVEMLHTSLDLETRLHEVTLPFFLVHGEADVVTDPAISRELYDSANSFDKTIKTYPNMWHGLTSGEPDENIDLVFRDIINWLDKRCPPGTIATSPIRYAEVQKKYLSEKPLKQVDLRQKAFAQNFKYRSFADNPNVSMSVPGTPLRYGDRFHEIEPSSSSVPASPLRFCDLELLREGMIQDSASKLILGHS